MQSIQLKNLHQTQISFELNIIHTPLKFLLDGAYFSCFQLSALHFPFDEIKWARTKLIMLLSIYLCGRGQYQEIIIKFSSIEEVQISFVTYYQQVFPNPRKVLYFLYLKKFSFSLTKT